MAELPQGAVLAGCRVEGVIGRGGMGVVYRATQLSLDRAVALKAIAPEFADDVTFRERFKRESRIAASIEHPNVIPVYDSGEGDGVLYLIMRYVQGTDLRALIDSEHGLEVTRASRIVGQVAEALAAAHRRDLLHRDVKPANVLIDSEEERDHAYLTDFGVARSAGASSGLTRTGSVVGTVDYLAPERIQEQGGDGRSDVYALGCVLFETLTGKIPYARDNDMAKMYAHLSAPVPSVRELAPAVPEELDELARRAMAKDPAERPPTAAALAEALDELTQPRAPSTQASPPPPAAVEPPRDGVAATELAATRARPSSPERRPPPPPAAAPPPRPPSRRRPLLLGLGGAGVIVAAVVLVLVLSGGDSADDKSSGPPPAFHQVRSTQISPEPDGMAADDDTDTVWVANRTTNEAVAIDAASPADPQRIPVGAEPDSIAVGFGSIWVTNTGDDSVTRIGANSRAETGKIGVGDSPEGIAVSGDAVWVANGGAGTVTRIGADGTVKGTQDVGAGPVQIAVADGRVWVTLSDDDEVVELDAKTGKPIAGHVAKVQGQPRGIAFDGTRLWVAATGANDVASFRPDDPGRVATLDVAEPREVRFGLGAIWVTTGDSGNLVAIDPETRKQVATFAVGKPTYGLAVSGSSAWAASTGGHLIEVKPK